MRTNLDPVLVVTDFDPQRPLPILEQSNTPASELLDWELQRATIVEQRSVSPEVVTMNSEVVYEDFATGARRTVKLVYPRDADASRGWISVLAPIGTALLGLKVGQEIEWQLPAGRKRVFVVEIRYQPESRGHYHLQLLSIGSCPKERAITHKGEAHARRNPPCDRDRSRDALGGIDDGKRDPP